MNENDKKLMTVRYLLSKSLEGDITAEQIQQLDNLVVEDPEARRYYVEFMQVHVSLRKLLQKEETLAKSETTNVLDDQLWQQLAHHEQTAESIFVEQQQAVEQKADLPINQSISSKRILRRSTVYSIAASIAAVLFVIIYISIVPLPNPIVATVVDSINAQWEEPGWTLEPGDDIRTEPQKILSGVISLEFESGVQVLIEGPAEFTPMSTNSMQLSGGKAFAHVPDTAIGFTIETPQSSLVDLGTEFGVAVSPLSGSEIHVYDGKINLVAGLAQQPKVSEILQQSQARRVDARQGQISNAKFKNYLFVQEISSEQNRILYGPPLHLSSFISGGDGLSPGDQPSGIDPSTGLINDIAQQDFERKGQNIFNRVDNRPFVDGVFIPNGPGVVDSAGHLFEGFPVSDGAFWADISATPFFNYIGLDSEGQVLYRQQFVASLSAESEADSAKSVILLHANSGVTFDLNRIRETYDDAELDRFRAACGVSKNVMTKMQQEFWVLLDGQRVFHYFRSGEDLTPQIIDIPIRPENSFLTLAVTQGGDNNSFDWSLFEEAVLELIPKTIE